jgi:hypothetical protein
MTSKSKVWVECDFEDIKVGDWVDIDYWGTEAHFRVEKLDEDGEVFYGAFPGCRHERPAKYKKLIASNEVAMFEWKRIVRKINELQKRKLPLVRIFINTILGGGQ